MKNTSKKLWEWHNNIIKNVQLLVFVQCSCAILMIRYPVLNNAEYKIILCRMLEIVYAENSEQFLWKNSEQFYLMQKPDFMNVVSRFEYTVNMMCRE